MNRFSALGYSPQNLHIFRRHEKIQQLAESKEPLLANVGIENIVDDELLRKLHSSGFIDRVIAGMESSDTQVAPVL